MIVNNSHAFNKYYLVNLIFDNDILHISFYVDI